MEEIQIARTSIQQAKENVQGVRSDISKRREELGQARRIIEAQERQLKSQKALRTLKPEERGKRTEILKALKSGKQDIKSAFSKLSSFEQGQIQPYESQITGVEQRLNQYETAQNLVNAGYGTTKNIKNITDPEVRNLVLEISGGAMPQDVGVDYPALEQEYRAVEQANITKQKAIESGRKFKLFDLGRLGSVESFEIPSVNVFSTPVTKEPSQPQQSIIAPPDQPENIFGKFTQNLNRISASQKQKGQDIPRLLTETGKVGTALASGIINYFGANRRSTPPNILEELTPDRSKVKSPKFFFSSIGQEFKNFDWNIRNDPLRATAQIAGNYLMAEAGGRVLGFAGKATGGLSSGELATLKTISKEIPNLERQSMNIIGMETKPGQIEFVGYKKSGNVASTTRGVLRSEGGDFFSGKGTTLFSDLKGGGKYATQYSSYGRSIPSEVIGSYNEPLKQIKGRLGTSLTRNEPNSFLFQRGGSLRVPGGLSEESNIRVFKNKPKIKARDFFSVSKEIPEGQGFFSGKINPKTGQPEIVPESRGVIFRDLSIEPKTTGAGKTAPRPSVIQKSESLNFGIPSESTQLENLNKLIQKGSAEKSANKILGLSGGASSSVIPKTTISKSSKVPAIIQPTQKENVFLPQKQEQRFFQNSKSRSNIDNILGLRSNQRTQLFSNVRRTQNITPLSTQDINITPKTRDNTRSRSMVRVRQGSKSKLRSIFDTQTTTTQQSISEPPIKPIIPVIKKEKKSDKIKDLLEGEEGIYEIFKRVKGKDIFSGIAKSRKEAFGKLEGGLRSDLSASGFVSKGGQKIKPTNLDLGLGFRTAKRDIFRVVQKRSFRLGTPQEVFKIQKARSKKKRIKRRDWFS